MPSVFGHVGTEYATQVVVNNQAPTATFGNDGPVEEGQQATIFFTDQADSAGDLAAAVLAARVAGPYEGGRRDSRCE